jgi:tRNA pseudouridine32 synthase/23S rRNA pseudouridine746 synthase
MITEISQKFETHLDILTNDMTAIDLLAKQLPFSKQKLKQIMHQGAVWLTQGKSTQRLRRASKTLCQGQTLHCYYDANVLAQHTLPAQLIADEQHYSVWFKPFGMLSQGSKFGDHTTLYRWSETHLQPQRNAFLVHRLDRATSGLMLIAHSKKAARLLSQMFSERMINKYYKALVQGIPVAHQIIDRPLDNKKAITKLLSVTPQNKQYSLLDLQILTGRKHQIRQHLSAINHPIIGDRLYGDASDTEIDLCLTAYKILFTSPFDQQQKQYELSKEYYPSNQHNQEK